MTWQRLKRSICSPPQITAGNLQAKPIVIEDIRKSPCYTVAKYEHRFQGDVYSGVNFTKTPTPLVPYWMLLNRTCHLVESSNRQVKLPYLVFCAVVPLTTFISGKGQSIKNQITNLVNNKNEGQALLPADQEMEIAEPLVVDFNMIYSIKLDECPSASKKILQLSSPFGEHLVQRFSRWFYTVGYDDSELKSQEYIGSLIKICEEYENKPSG